ncbi:MAG: DUF58 domain-containing protein, partial [Gemmataceae bacterium]|nr:DUF58 domain-containing protein [Gemmataceae bacterium]
MTLPRHWIRQIHRLHLRSRRWVQELFAGAYHSVFKGVGLRFEEVREYQPGDEIRLIDWNVTARMGTPFVKRYIEEREQTLWLLVDLSRSLSFGTRPLSKRAVAAEVATLLSLSALLNQDRVGLIVFTDRVETFFPPSKGLPHTLKILRQLCFAEPRGSGTDVAGALDFLNRIQKRRAIVFLFSDFLVGDQSRIEKPLRRAARRHDLTLVRILDPAETRPLPPGLWWVEDAETGERRLIDTLSSASGT